MGPAFVFFLISFKFHFYNTVFFFSNVPRVCNLLHGVALPTMIELPLKIRTESREKSNDSCNRITDLDFVTSGWLFAMDVARSPLFRIRNPAVGCNGSDRSSTRSKHSTEPRRGTYRFYRGKISGAGCEAHNDLLQSAGHQEPSRRSPQDL